MSSYGVWLSATGMKLAEHRQAVLANNMANADTAGFKHDLAVVAQRRVESAESPTGAAYAHPVLDGMAGGAHVRPVFHSFLQGSIEHTGRPLDAAIHGDGFFVVADGSDTRYTRDGRFAVNSEGELVLAAGEGAWRVLDEEGAPILLNPQAGQAEVSHDGAVRQNGAVVARLGLVAPGALRTAGAGASGTHPAAGDLQTMRKIGGNLFQATGPMVPAGGRIEPGSVEESTFDVMQGLASMIEATRAYQLNATMIRIQDEVTDQAINRVGRVT